MFWLIVFLVVIAIAATYVIVRMRDAARADKALRRPPAPDDDPAFLRDVQDKLLRDERDRGNGNSNGNRGNENSNGDSNSDRDET